MEAAGLFLPQAAWSLSQPSPRGNSIYWYAADAERSSSLFFTDTKARLGLIDFTIASRVNVYPLSLFRQSSSWWIAPVRSTIMAAAGECMKPVTPLFLVSSLC